MLSDSSPDFRSGRILTTLCHGVHASLVIVPLSNSPDCLLPPKRAYYLKISQVDICSAYYGIDLAETAGRTARNQRALRQGARHPARRIHPPRDRADEP